MGAEKEPVMRTWLPKRSSGTDARNRSETNPRDAHVVAQKIPRDTHTLVFCDFQHFF